MSLRLSRLLHAGYLFECQGTRVIFDPVFENPLSHNCYAYPDVQFDTAVLQSLKVDAVLISHYHEDHFCLESLNHFPRQTPIYLFTVFPELLELIRQLGFTRVHAIEIDHHLQFGPLRIHPLEALDADVDSLFHVQAEGCNILHVVDSWIGPNTFSRLQNVANWDLVLWPMQTMRELEVIAPEMAPPIDATTGHLPVEWQEQLKILNPRVLVPSSCQFRFEEGSWYNSAFFPVSYANFASDIFSLLPRCEVLRLNPGETLTWRNQQFHKEGRLDWVHPVGPQDVDYVFDPTLPPTPMPELATRFPALTETQRDRLDVFLHHELIERSQQLTADSCEFFSQRRHWQLVTYDHQGQARSFFFEVWDNQIRPQDEVRDIDWRTQICETKLFGALENGESLTSIYIRISPQGKGPSPADPLEDPLLRVLFEGQIGSYQKAQLRRLTAKSDR